MLVWILRILGGWWRGMVDSALIALLRTFSSHRLSIVEFCFSSSMSTGCVVPLRGDWAIFCHAGSGRVINQGKSFEILRHGWELDQGHGEDRHWDTFILSLSYHDPGHGEDRQWDTFILPLSYHNLGHGEDRQWDSFILSLSYHGWLAFLWFQISFCSIFCPCMASLSQWPVFGMGHGLPNRLVLWATLGRKH